ncbi:MAG: TonB C-terminal domain-containing protein [Gammaproteobacteria bacterium]
MARRSKFQRYLPAIGGSMVIVIVLGGVYLFGKGMGGGAPPKPPEIQEISIVVPPPPPPPPPEMEKPPEPEIEEVEVPEPDPEPLEDVAEADEPPPGEQLGLDAEGVAGADGFGLAARKGGRGLIGGGDRETWYASRLERDIETAFARNRDLRRREFSVTLRLWIARTGAIEDSEMVRGTGNAELDRTIESALRTQARIKDVPPDDMQPVTLRIVSRS